MASARLVTPVGSSGGATAAGSGGRLDGTVVSTGSLVLSAASVTTIASGSPAWAASVAAKLPSAAATTVTACPVRRLVTVTRAPASTVPAAPATVTAPSSGSLTVIVPEAGAPGATVSSVTVTLAVPGFPAASRATTSIRFAPSASVSGAVAKVRSGPSVGVAAPSPFTRTITVAGSLTDPATTCAGALVTSPSVGAVRVTTGATVSTVTVTEAGAEALPARSATVASSACGPSASTTAGVQLTPVAVAGSHVTASGAPSSVIASVSGSTPAPRSSQVSASVGVPVGTAAPSAGAANASVGAVRSSATASARNACPAHSDTVSSHCPPGPTCWTPAACPTHTEWSTGSAASPVMADPDPKNRRARSCPAPLTRARTWGIASQAPPAPSGTANIGVPRRNVGKGQLPRGWPAPSQRYTRLWVAAQRWPVAGSKTSCSTASPSVDRVSVTWPVAS
ncbi:MAG TPA: hypothetical protein VF406_08685 [Thermodesulfobacteriota bacterium]